MDHMETEEAGLQEESLGQVSAFFGGTGILPTRKVVPLQNSNKSPMHHILMLNSDASSNFQMVCLFLSSFPYSPGVNGTPNHSP